MLRGKVGSPKTYHALLYAQGDQGYDSVIVAPSKDAGNAFAALARSQWSTWWRDSFVIDGEPVDGSVRAEPFGQPVQLEKAHYLPDRERLARS